MTTQKELVWLTEYLKCWNATEAARRAGYKWPNKLGPRKLAKFEKQISERLKKKIMDADEVLARLADQARGSIADFINMEVKGGIIDFNKAQELGLMHLIKSITWTKSGVKIELYDAQNALVHLGRYHGLFKDRIEYSWRDEAEKEGIDPNAVYNQLVNEFVSAMDGSGDRRSVEGREQESSGL